MKKTFQDKNHKSLNSHKIGKNKTFKIKDHQEQIGLSTDEKVTFKCEKCTFTTKWKLSLKRHNINLHEKRPDKKVTFKGKNVLEWPNLPDGFHPSAENRNYDITIANNPQKEDVILKEISVIRINGKIIEEWIEDDKEFLDTDDDKNIPDFTEVQGQCMICNVRVDKVTKLVLHLHEDHQIEGGPSNLMKDAKAFIEKGFIKLV